MPTTNPSLLSLFLIDSMWNVVLHTRMSEYTHHRSTLWWDPEGFRKISSYNFWHGCRGLRQDFTVLFSCRMAMRAVLKKVRMPEIWWDQLIRKILRWKELFGKLWPGDAIPLLLVRKFGTFAVVKDFLFSLILYTCLTLASTAHRLSLIWDCHTWNNSCKYAVLFTQYLIPIPKFR